MFINLRVMQSSTGKGLCICIEVFIVRIGITLSQQPGEKLVLATKQKKYSESAEHSFSVSSAPTAVKHGAELQSWFTSIYFRDGLAIGQREMCSADGFRTNQHELRRAKGWECLLVNKSQLSQGREIWRYWVKKFNAHLPEYSTLKSLLKYHWRRAFQLETFQWTPADVRRTQLKRWTHLQTFCGACSDSNYDTGTLFASRHNGIMMFWPGIINLVFFTPQTTSSMRSNHPIHPLQVFPAAKVITPIATETVTWHAASVRLVTSGWVRSHDPGGISGTLPFSWPKFSPSKKSPARLALTSVNDSTSNSSWCDAFQVPLYCHLKKTHQELNCRFNCWMKI